MDDSFLPEIVIILEGFFIRWTGAGSVLAKGKETTRIDRKIVFMV